MDAPDWLRREVAAGLQALLLLRLESSPAADTIVGVLEVWLVALADRRAWSEERDTERVRRGFAVLSGRLTRWPAPVQLLEALPQPPAQRALPGPARLTRQGREALAYLRARLADCAKSWPAPGPEDYADGPAPPLRRWAKTPSREEQILALERRLAGGCKDD